MPRILLINWSSIATGATSGGGVGGYCRALALELVRRGAEVTYLSSGRTLTKRGRRCRVLARPEWGGMRVIEIVNSPVRAPSRLQWNDPSAEIKSEVLERVFEELIDRISPDAIHFHNIEGLTAGCLERASQWARMSGARVLASIHNYHCLCPQVYLLHEGIDPCTDFDNGHACVSCLRTCANSESTPRAETLPKHIGPLYRAWSSTAASEAQKEGSLGWVPLDNEHLIAPKSLLEPNEFGHRRQAMISALAHCDKVLAVSSNVRDALVANGLDPENIDVDPIGTDMTRFARGRRRTAPLVGPLRLLFLGYGVFPKGLDLLADALGAMDDAVLSQLSLTVHAPKCSARVQRLLGSLQDRFAAFDLRSEYRFGDIPAICDAHDVGIVPSVWMDPAPQTVLEFRACGLPVIGASLGGIPEQIKEGVDGFLFQGRDLSDLSQLLRTLTTEPQRARALRGKVRPPLGIAEHASAMLRRYQDPEPPTAQVRSNEGEIIAIVPTYSRYEVLLKTLRAIEQQNTNREINVVIIDNASTDDTINRLKQELGARVVARNLSNDPARPVWSDIEEAEGSRYLIIENQHNLGGSGGFHTGLTWIRRARSPEFAWLVDDDAVPEPDAAGELVKVMRESPRTGLCAARSVHPDRPELTLESTVYLDRANGCYRDDAPLWHRHYETFSRWIDLVGATRGVGEFTGATPCDIVPACCLLARWAAVEEVGPWRAEFFIYEDDAEWCLRFAERGWDVVLAGDAVVRHLPWHAKRSLDQRFRLDYFQTRNHLALLARHTPNPERSRVLRQVRFRELRLSKSLLWNRSARRSTLIREAVRDASIGRAGARRIRGANSQSLSAIVARFAGQRLVVAVDQVGSAIEALNFMEQWEMTAAASGAAPPKWLVLYRPPLALKSLTDQIGAREHLSRAHQNKSLRTLPDSWRSRIRLETHRPDSAIVVNDRFASALLRCPVNIHAYPGSDRVSLERDGLFRRTRARLSWSWIAWRCSFRARVNRRTTIAEPAWPVDS